MIYVSIDTETTGLDPETDQILEIGAIIENTKTKLPREKCPTFHCYIKHDKIVGNLYALTLNYNILKHILELSKDNRDEKVLADWNVTSKFGIFLHDNGIEKAVVAGKNFGTFDLHFLNKLPTFKKNISFNHRFLDPSSLFVDFNNDFTLPNLEQCKKRAGFDKTSVSHTSLDDAWDVIELLRTKY